MFANSRAAFDAAHRRVMLGLWLLFAFVLLVLVLGGSAFADTVSTVATAPDGPVSTTTQVGIPIGDWLADAAVTIVSISGALILWAARFLPGSVLQILQTMQADQLLNKAIAYAVNAVAGAEKGKVLTVDTGNAVVAKAVQYVIDHGPGWMTDWLGGSEAIAQKIIARLEVAPDAAIVAPVAPSATLVAPLKAA